MNKEFFKALDLLEKQKNIPKEYMLQKVEAALQSAFKKDNGYSNVRVVLDPVKQDVKVYKQLLVVDPEGWDEIPLKTELSEEEIEAMEEYPEEALEEESPEDVDLDLDEEFEDEEDENTRFEYDEEGNVVKKLKKHVFNERTEITLEQAREIKKSYNYGDIVEIEVKTKNFGRISAQTAKQVIIQGIREAERDIMVKEYEGKKDEIVSAIVTRVDPVTGNAVLTLGRNEVTLFKNEQIPGERLVEGDKIKVYVTVVKKETKGPSIVLSRKHPGLVKRLFELEVPEIQDGTVIIKSISREAGSRTKIAVYSRDDNVDPIGSCIGPKGIRKNNITSEIKGEKIDIIKYSEDAEEFIRAALSPAQVVSVKETGERSCYVLVEDDQLSLAIGKEGQNARLAARLTGFNKIDIKSVSAARSAAFNEIMEGKKEASGSFGGKLAEALKLVKNDEE
ncbi:MAG: transcription termination/antitermination protein NusA [Ruminococcaceae bacterium]|nr:transcription termination/antitermination protein NusA [Oscillospiraceae bacterium]